MALTNTNIDPAVSARLPFWYLLSILNGLIQNIGWAAKHMNIMELLQGPTGPSEDIMWG